MSLPSFPETLGSGSTVLVAGTVDPSHYALGLRALCQYGHDSESALVVTTIESADQTCSAYERVCSTDRPLIGLVDTTSERQYVSSFYRDSPTVYTPSSADLERIVIALSDLTESKLPTTETRHLVIRSLTPLLRSSPSKRVCRVLQRITGLRTGTGIGFFGLNYTEHDKQTIAELSHHVDGILWVTQGSDHDLEFEYQAARNYSR
ncbi:DUF7504 family protein [Natronosalvus caseinilyticus]|uniref:DUF7504 family protein n=1 Tax=Natronosalvus caseinilyticus TaxID=2953747 RepID=UPI003CCD461B